MTDVAIVGGGPAGSTLALALARAGCDVTIVERSRFPREKVCGDYLSTAAVNAIGQLGLAGTALADAYPVRSIALYAFGSHLRLRFAGEGARSMPRSVLDQRLLQAALEAGARLLHGSYMDAQEDHSRMRVIYRDEHGTLQGLTSRVLVGADGAWSAVARRSGMAPKRTGDGRWAVGGQLVDQSPTDELEMYVSATGYYARNPLSDDVANSMLVLPKPAPSGEADAIVETMTRGRRRFEPEKIKRKVAIGPLRYMATKVAAGRILLTGDAAGLLNPFTGQGVANAVQLSPVAASAVLALLRGESSARVAARYTREWRALVIPRKALCTFVDMLIGLRSLRERALRRIQKDAVVAEALLACVSGAAPAREAFSLRLLWGLLA